MSGRAHGPRKTRCPAAEAAGHRARTTEPVAGRDYFILLPADFRCWAASTTRAAMPASAALP